MLPKGSVTDIGMTEKFLWAQKSKASSGFTSQQLDSLSSQALTEHSKNSNSCYMTPKIHSAMTTERESILQMAPNTRIEKRAADKEFINTSQQLSQIMSQVECQEFGSQSFGGDDSEHPRLRDNAKKGTALFTAMSECEENDEMEDAH